MTSADSAGGFQIGEGVSFLEIEKDAVIMNVSDQQCYSLNYMGTRIWGLLLQRMDAERVAREIASEFDIDAETVRGDIESLIGDLVERKLLTAVPN